MNTDKRRSSISIDESCNATESSSMASSLDEFDSEQLIRDDCSRRATCRTKQHTSLLHVESFVTKPKMTNNEVSTCNGSGSNRSNHAHSSGKMIRSRLLNKLGFEPEVFQKQATSVVAPPPSFHENKAFFVRLKDDKGTVGNNSTVLPKTDHSLVEDEEDKTKHRIAFHPEVKVQPIPSHADFSERIRRVMWMDAVEMENNTARNYIEYSAEGWDWRNVIDDKDMIVVNGEKIHPVHFANQQYNYHSQLATVMSTLHHDYHQ